MMTLPLQVKRARQNPLNHGAHDPAPFGRGRIYREDTKKTVFWVVSGRVGWIEGQPTDPI